MKAESVFTAFKAGTADASRSERMVYFMKCLNKVLTIIGCITAIVAVAAAAFAVLSYFDKKKEDAELEEYLEGAIQ